MTTVKQPLHLIAKLAFPSVAGWIGKKAMQVTNYCTWMNPAKSIDIEVANDSWYMLSKQFPKIA